MKIRFDFVTNSSSSNFIFAFKDLDDYNAFVNYCDSYDYGQVLEVIENQINLSERVYDKEGDLRLHKDTEDYRQEILNNCYHMLSIDISRAMTKDILAKEHGSEKFDFKQELDYRAEIESREDFKASLLEKVRLQTNWVEIEQILKSSSIIVEGTIWDTDGGLVEWAFRNGFLSSELSNWCVLDYNIG